MPTATVLYFAQVRDRLGREQERLELPAATSAAAILVALGARHPHCATAFASCRVAVDCRFIAGEVVLAEGAEIAVIPPVSGG
jgi:molybdopterin converting factor subunit 1